MVKAKTHSGSSRHQAPKSSGISSVYSNDPDLLRYFLEIDVRSAKALVCVVEGRLCKFSPVTSYIQKLKVFLRVSLVRLPPKDSDRGPDRNKAEHLLHFLEVSRMPSQTTSHYAFAASAYTTPLSVVHWTDS